MNTTRTTTSRLPYDPNWALRHAHLGPLRGVQRHDHAPDHVAENDRCGPGPQRQAEHRRRQRAGDDRKQHDVGAEPHREQVTGPAVSFVDRNVLDGAAFDLPGKGCGCAHRDRLSPFNSGRSYA